MAMCVFTTLNHQVPPHSGAKTRGSKYTGQSIKPLPIHLLTVGKTRSPGVQLIVKEYMDKLKPYCPVHDLRIRSNPKNSIDARVQIENEEMGFMNFIKADDWVVMLDENGMDLKSEEMADLIGDAGGSRLVFCIGGAYGHGMKLRERANVKEQDAKELPLKPCKEPPVQAMTNTKFRVGVLISAVYVDFLLVNVALVFVM